jgi:hypothetical protein
VVVAYFKLLSRNSPRETERNYENLQFGWSVPCSGLGPSRCWFQGRSVRANWFGSYNWTVNRVQLTGKRFSASADRRPHSPLLVNSQTAKVWMKTIYWIAMGVCTENASNLGLLLQTNSHIAQFSEIFTLIFLENVRFSFCCCDSHASLKVSIRFLIWRPATSWTLAHSAGYCQVLTTLTRRHIITEIYAGRTKHISAPRVDNPS